MGKENIRTDCAFINRDQTECAALDKLYCAKNPNCKFHKTPEQYDRAKVEKEIKLYSSRAALKD